MIRTPNIVRSILACLLGVTFLLSCSTAVLAQPNLLKDGGFEAAVAPGAIKALELSGFQGWKALPGGDKYGIAGLPNDKDIGAPPFAGSDVLFLVEAGVTQGFPTVAGRQYQVRLNANGVLSNPGSLTLRIYDSANPAQVDLSAKFSSQGGGIWTQREFLFTASGANSTLEIRGGGTTAVLLDEVSISTPPTEFTVFGTEERKLTTEDAVEDWSTTETPSPTPRFFNHKTRTTRAFSEISSRTLIIDDAGPPERIYRRTQDFDDISDVTVMAETVVIRSPWRLKQTHVTIRARELRFEGQGRIITSPAEILETPTNATGPAGGSNGTDGAPAGDVEVYADKITDLTIDRIGKFVMTGGKGQDAGKGKHGANGTSVGSVPDLAVKSDVFPTVTYTATDGYGITWIQVDGFRGHSVFYGSATLPTSGEDAWPSGKPGNGGPGGKLTAYVATPVDQVAVDFGGGSPGEPGKPALSIPAGPNDGPIHSSSTVCEGGSAGTPRLSEWLSVTEYLFRSSEIISVAKFPSTLDGKSYPVPVGARGTNGSRSSITTSFGWVHPLLLRRILGDVRQDYLQNRIEQVRTRLTDYVGVLELFMKDSVAWSRLEEIDRLELAQIRDEMRRLLQQASHGLDYFGNPAGWVPMLSLEVSSDLFEKEIDRSLDIIYLARWIGSRQANAAAQVSALETARKKLAAEIADQQQKYAETYASLEVYKSDAESIKQRLINLGNILRVRETTLANQAEANTAPPEWETGLRLSLKIVGIGAKMIPAYQPALGAVGDGLNLASEFDPEQPWDSIQKIPDIASSYLDAKAAQLAADQAGKVSTAGMNPQELAEHTAHEKRLSKLQDLSNASSQLSEGMKGVTDLLQRSKVPSPKLNAELEKLKAADPEFSTTTDEIKDLVEKERIFTDRIVTGINKVAEYSDTITRDLLAIDSLNTRTGESLAVLDQRVSAYLDDMEQRAWDRLLKYHYYVAKAYEYRLVAPYTERLDLSGLYKKIAEIADASRTDGTSGELVKDSIDQKALHSLFRDLIASTTQKIVERFQKDSYERSQFIDVQLTPAEIAALNRGEAITLNLVEQNKLSGNEEDIRIRDIYLVQAGDLGTKGVPSGTAFAQLNIEHSGLSNIRKNGTVNQFRHYNQETVSRITWRPRVGLSAVSGPSMTDRGSLTVAADESLLRSLAKVADTSGLLLYSSPAAWADLKVWREIRSGGVDFGLGDSAAPITITNVSLRVEYDYTRKPVNQQAIEVLFARPDDRSTTSPDDETADLAPEVRVSAPDLNGRQDARGRFLRVYNSGSPAQVTMTVPERIGALRFWKWTDNTVDVANSSPVLTVPTSRSHRLVAFYTPVYPASYRQGFENLGTTSGVADGTTLTSDGSIAGVGRPANGGSALKLSDVNAPFVRSQWVLQRLAPATYGFVADFDYQVLSPASGPPADGFGFYLKPANEPVDVTGNAVGGYARGLGIEFNTYASPGCEIRVDGTVLPARYSVSPAVDAAWHRMAVQYRTAPGQTGGTLTVKLDGRPILTEVAVPFVPGKDDVFAFVGRTGGFTQTTWLDNVQVTPLAAPLVVNEVNDAPSFTIGPDQTATAGSGPQVVNGWATAISPGPADEATQALVFLVDTDKPSLFAVAPAIDRAGRLTYTPAANAQGAAIVTVRLKDDGGTANGGVDTSAAGTFQITIVASVREDLAVSNANDSGAGSLRQALLDAAATPGPDRVIFAAGVPGPIRLDTPIEVVDADGVTVDASSEPAGITVSGGNSHRLFRIVAGSIVSFRRLRLTDGAVNGGYPEGYGGAVLVEGSLTLVECTVSGNTAFAGGAAAIAGNGVSVLALERTTISGNSAGYGGAVQAEGRLTASGTTFAGNSADAVGGAISAPFGNQVELNHCTLSANTAVDQGGGIIGDNVTLRYSIVAGNTAGSDTNLSGVPTVSESSLTSGDPRLAVLGNNGGPTPTMALLAGSPARDAATGSTATADQRGVAVSGTPDIGAFEAQFGGIADATTLEDNPVTVSFRGGNIVAFSAVSEIEGFLRGAEFGGSGDQRALTLVPAHDRNGTSTITVADAATGESTTLRLTVTPVNDAPGFSPGADQTVNSGSGSQAVDGWATAISAGPADESGQALVFVVGHDSPSLFAVAPAIDPTGKLTYTPAANVQGTATVTVRLKDDGGTANAGVDTSAARTFRITVVGATQNEFTVSNSSNSGPGSLRQALLDAAAKPGADRVVFTPGFQGPIRLETPIEINDAEAVTVDAGSEPAGVTVNGGTGHRLFRIAAGSTAGFRRLRLTGGTVDGGYPDGYGGAVFVEGNLSLIECSLTGNSAFAGGAAAIASNGAASLGLERTTISGNTASYGGAVQAEGRFTANASTFSGNGALVVGGAISAPFGNVVQLIHCTVSGNFAVQQGGGVIGDNVTVRYSIVAGNGSGKDANLSGVPALSEANLLGGDPLLDALADNGGPTQTMALRPDSPARDAATGSTATADQRGMAMVGNPDIGAFEAQPNDQAIRLSYLRTGTGLVISWPNTPGAILESARQIAAGTAWQSVPFETVGNTSSKTITAINGAAFEVFRLRRP